MKTRSLIYHWLRDLYLRGRGLASGGALSARVNDFRLRLPSRCARHFPRDYEEGNFRFLASHFRPGMTGIDVGAHLGIYSVRMAQLGAARVHAFEPTPSTNRLLHQVIALNKVEDRVHVHPLAVGAQTGSTIFFLNEPADRLNRLSVSEANSLRFIDHGSTIRKDRITVQVVSLDQFAAENDCRPGFLKIDAEGTELDILAGASELLRRHRPAGIVSLHLFTYENRDQSLLQFWELLSAGDYRLVHEDRPLDLAGLREFASKDIVDIHFLPR